MHEFNTLANQELDDFALTLDTSKEISMLHKNEKGVFFKNRNEPKQSYVTLKYFKIKPVLIERENHKDIVTQKGLFWLGKMFEVVNEKSQTALLN